MVSITFPDGDTKTYDDGVTPLAVAKSISSKLAKRAIAAKLNGDLVDLTRAIDSDASLELVTKDQEDALEVLRHSTSHRSSGLIRSSLSALRFRTGFTTISTRPSRSSRKTWQRLKRRCAR
jgi:threonyl-tRNA synthetase